MATQVAPSLAVKKFKIMHTTADGNKVAEEPRLMITADCKHKSLFLGDGPIATVDYDTPDQDLWDQARARFVK